MNKIFTAILPVACLILLSPMLAFPISPDLSCFVMGGKVILGGGSLYVDFIDLKSPVVYYFLAGVVGIFGDSPFSIRLFDLIWQLSTAMSIFYFAKKFYSPNFAKLAAFLYCWIYMMMAWGNSFECETTVALPLVWAIGLFCTGSTLLKRYILPGFLLSFVVAFKYTFGLIAFPFIYFIIFGQEKPWEKRLKELAVSILVFLCGFALFHFPLLNGRIYSGYMELVGFLSCYSSFPKYDWFDIYFLSKILFMPNGRMVSIGIGLLFFVGVFVSFRKVKESKERELITILVSIYLLNLLTIILEKKGFPYHFLRNAVPISLIVPVGIKYSFEQFKQWRNKKKTAIIIFCGISIGLAIAAPSFTVARNFIILYNRLTNESKYLESVTDPGRTTQDWPAYKKIMEVIDSTTGQQSKIINLSICDLPLIIHGKYEGVSSFAHSYIYEGGCYNSSYLAKAAKDYKKADWILARDNDDLTFFTGRSISSYASIVSEPILNAVLDSCFVVYTEVDGCKMLLNRAALHRLHKAPLQ